jgi:hypothetical protein
VGRVGTWCRHFRAAIEGVASELRRGFRPSPSSYATRSRHESGRAIGELVLRVRLALDSSSPVTVASRWRRSSDSMRETQGGRIGTFHIVKGPGTGSS